MGPIKRSLISAIAHGKVDEIKSIKRKIDSGETDCRLIKGVNLVEIINGQRVVTKSISLKMRV